MYGTNNKRIIIENEIELFPKHVTHELMKEKRRSRSLVRRPNYRSSSESRGDMRLIDDFFSPKRKASDLITSPTSECTAKMSKTSNSSESPAPLDEFDINVVELTGEVTSL